MMREAICSPLGPRRRCAMFDSIVGRAAAILLCGAVVAASGCGGDDLAKFPEFRIDPDKFLFPRVAIDQTVTREVQIINPGRGELVVRGLRLRDQSSAGEFELFMRAEDSKLVEVPTRFTVAPNEEQRVVLVVRYTPRDDQTDSGAVTFETNAENAASVAIDITTESAGAQIKVSPPTLDFGRVSAAEEAVMTTTVLNFGTVDLNIENLIISGSQDFVPLVQDKDPRRQPEVLDDPDGDGNPGLSAGNQFDIEVRYSPSSEGPDFGQLSVISDDPNTPEIAVNLIANGATPCLAVNPPALEFRTSLVNRTDSRPLTLQSCGSQPLEIKQIIVDGNGDPSFDVDREQLEESLGTLPVILPAATPGEPSASRTIRVTFTPREQRIYNGRLLIETNDPVTPIREVELLGRGVTNACPQPRVTVEEHFVEPLDVVLLDGSPSVDSDGPDNKPVSYRWVVISRPDGSISPVVEDFFNPGEPDSGGFPDDESSPTAAFFVDLAGSYTIELHVTDNLGLDTSLCDNPAVVQIEATPDEDIHIQLVWRTPSDPDETDDQGSDLDLHLLHPSASNWFTAPYDCYYKNPTPEWGIEGDDADNPSIDIDDTNGGGPENINLNDPENTVTLSSPYLLGVHYYRSSDRRTGTDFGSAFARVRVFLSGQLAWSFDDAEREMRTEDAFWDVAQINWPAASVDTRDRYYDQRP